MHFTDVFIKRPVLATVVSMMILLLGFKAFETLSIRQYPKLENAVISITTTYAGASSDVIQGFITTPIQQAIASAEGIDYITSSSQQSVSSVKANLILGYDANAALTEIMAKVAEVQNELPEDADKPVVAKESARGTALLYMSFYSEEMNNEQVTDYLTRVVQPKLATIEGVAEAEILGKKTFAMRIWLDPVKMAAHGITSEDINQAIRTNNFLSAAGETKGEFIVTGVNAKTDLTSPTAFGNIVIASREDALVRVKDVARVELSAESFDSYVAFNGIQSVYMAISSTPSANPLEVIQRVRNKLPEVKKQLPSALKADIVYDATRFIEASINEVVKTLIEATVIVIFVVFLFLGALRSVIIPVVTIPLSMVGVLFFMLVMGYSINLLTLLAMVLAIGLVVDDAIVVLENIHRHIEEGLSPYKAAILGAREIAMPVVAMTITLAAVYAPIGFLGGLTGKLFTEFAFTLAGAVIISGIIALTLSPMMCSKLLQDASHESKLAAKLDKLFDKLKQRFQRSLASVLQYRAPTVVFAIVILCSLPVMFLFIESELAPNEDEGVVFISSSSPQYANIDYMNAYTKQFESIFNSFPEYDSSFLVNGMGGVNNSIAGMILKPWDERERSQLEIQPQLQQKLNDIAGLQIFSFNMPPLPGSGGGLPVQFIVNTTADYRTLHQVTERVLAEARKSGKFMMITSDLKFDKPEWQVWIDRDKAARLGISMAAIGNALATMLGEGRVNRFTLDGRSYKVIPQAEALSRIDPSWLKRYYVRNQQNDLVPLSTVISTKKISKPNQLKQFQQLNAATIQGIVMPGVALGDALAFLNETADKVFPQGFGRDYSGVSRQFMQEGSALLITFVFALIVIYLVLAAQFESFRDPFVVLISVPMSIFGALVPLFLGVSTMNIYTQIGLVTLIGLISKHGILIVEFANQLQKERGYSVQQAVLEATAIRLRPVLMTTGAMVLGVVPLVLADGAGAISRFNIGLVIATGMTVGTLFTLYIVPTMYTFFARKHQEDKEADELVAQPAHHSS
ncbi:MexW/MexI family multidrug efflux RND transporter permease subunit [Zooshikella ganghwensis]|uniref:MexW/MexI family multidrug efflux RND transporter permease subunit n=1 Tax=Zooshikella ganghwensis TaxID=202772 RepID=A0A4P9VJL6_9GAMM|nr:MexW/MexI family multidrug efflux RND transporter permease subunit [Zooshikella ganghwensis]RDH43433.1 MexW/MexI family multidrug efflux RND transporter permease subunit [Zooshikella ganghwensis]